MRMSCGEKGVVCCFAGSTIGHLMAIVCWSLEGHHRRLIGGFHLENVKPMPQQQGEILSVLEIFQPSKRNSFCHGRFSPPKQRFLTPLTA